MTSHLLLRRSTSRSNGADFRRVHAAAESDAAAEKPKRNPSHATKCPGTTGGKADELGQSSFKTPLPWRPSAPPEVLPHHLLRNGSPSAVSSTVSSVAF